MEWEYHIEEIVFGQNIANLEEQLNELGASGWEAVATCPSPPIGTSGGWPVFVIFKKLKDSGK
jgi:hypothetical protein